MMEAEAIGVSGVVEGIHTPRSTVRWMKREAEGKINQLLYWRASTIFGGTNEIQRTIIWSSLSR